MKAVILAGGKGTRLKPYTNIFPKPLVPIEDKPVMEIIIHQLARYGFNDIIMAVGHLAELIQTFFDDGSKFGVNITYSREESPLGTAGPLLKVKDQLKDTFLMMNGDVLTTLDYSELVKFHNSSPAAATISLHNRIVDVDYGVVRTDESGKITDWLEKPRIDYQVSMGIYVLEPDALKYIPPDRPFDLPDLIKALVADGQVVKGYPFNGFWLDIGRPEDYEDALSNVDRLRELY